MMPSPLPDDYNTDNYTDEGNNNSMLQSYDKKIIDPGISLLLNSSSISNSTKSLHGDQKSKKMLSPHNRR